MSESRATTHLKKVLSSLNEDEAISSDSNIKQCIDKITKIILMPDPDKRMEINSLIEDAKQMKIRINYEYVDETETKKSTSKCHQRRRSSYPDITLHLDKGIFKKWQQDHAVEEKIKYMIEELHQVLSVLNPSPTELLKQRKAACSVSYDAVTSPREVKLQRKIVTFKCEPKLSWKEEFAEKLKELLKHLDNRAQLKLSAEIIEEKTEDKEAALIEQQKKAIKAIHDQILNRIIELTDEVPSEFSSLTKTPFEKRFPVFMPRRLTATERTKKNKDMDKLKMCAEKLKLEYLELTVTDFLADDSIKVFQNSCQFMLDQTAIAVERIKKATYDAFQTHNSVFYWEKPKTLRAIENVETRHRRRRSSIG